MFQQGSVSMDEMWVWNITWHATTMLLGMIHSAQAPTPYNIQAVLHQSFSRVAEVLCLYTLTAVFDGQIWSSHTT